jgi:anaerobic selenocysteine-containing dehydrogenase
MNPDKKQKTSRRNFLQKCGSVLAGTAIVGVSGILIHRNLTAEESQKQTTCISPNTSCSACEASCPIRK